MRFSPTVIVGFGVGYMLGARAGRERYDEIMRQLRDLRERPEVQSAAGVVSAQAGDLVTKVRSAVTGRAGRSGSDGGYAGAGVHSPNGSGRLTGA